MKRKTAIAALALVSLALSASASYARKKKEEKASGIQPAKELFTAMLQPGMPGSNHITVGIDAYSTDAEMQTFISADSHGGDDALQGALGKVKIGYFMVEGSQTIPLSLVRSVQNGHSRIIFMIGIHPPLWFQSSAASIFSDAQLEKGYPYSVIQFQLDAKGKGNGVLYQFAKLKLDAEGRPHITPGQRAPIKLVDVRPVKN